MFEPNLSIDVSLLAIILGLYATNNDRNLILVLICALFAHVLLTNDEDDLNAGVNQNASTDAVANDGLGATVTDAVATAITPTTVAKDESPVAPDGFKSTVSSGVFDRQLSSPQTNLTSTVFPSTSKEANGKLASARDSFFESLVS
ncbi:unnamed protein product [Ectocarpus sp. 6 AP-2014]